MAEEFEGDLKGAVFWGADLEGARFRDVNLTDATITHSWLVNVEIDALIEKLVINGVDVTDYVNERDPWHPLRSLVNASTPDDMRAAWTALEAAWATTISRARALPEEKAHESVGGEWSFVQTLRHVVFATDKWFTVPVLGLPFHPTGLPNTGSLDFPWPGLHHELSPSLEEELAVRAQRAELVREYLSTLAAEDLERPMEILENGTNPLRHCLLAVFEEAFWHNRYTLRDLEVLESN